MKVTIADVQSHKQIEPVMELYLESDDANKVILYGLDAHGRRWSIAQINSKGITLSMFIPKDLGWPVDENGSLKVV